MNCMNKVFVINVRFIYMCDPNSMTAEQYLKSSRIQTEKCQKSSYIDHVIESKVKGFEVIEEKINSPKLSLQLLPNKEWCSKLCHWFVYFRSFMNQNSENDNRRCFDDIVKDIEVGKTPTTDDLYNLEIACKVLSYFEKKQAFLSKMDLCWIFAALAKIDNLLTPDMGSSLQSLFTLINKQLSEINSLENELYPYLTVVYTLLARYFNQC